MGKGEGGSDSEGGKAESSKEESRGRMFIGTGDLVIYLGIE